MTDTPAPDKKPAEADRIAKVMARAGVASRREAERMIVEGRVSVNGRKIDSPALDVLPSDRIEVDGKRLDEKQETRLWLYYKPVGLVTSEADEKGRQTIFDALPRDLPRVITVGRLDLNSEGLLLLTNDGELKRRLELPATGWLRRYRVRVNGNPSDLTFAPLRRGVTIDGEEFAPMEVKLDSQQGANAWLTVGIREGKNREIRRAMAHVGLQVNRLIRIGYGPFKLTGLEKNQVTEVKRRVLRDQLGGLLTGETSEKEREMRPRGAEGPRRPRRDDAEAQADRPRKFRSRDADGEARPDKPRGGPDFPRRPREDSAGRSWAKSDKPRGAGPRGDAAGDRGGKTAGKFGGKPFAARGEAKGEGRPSGKPGARSGGGKPGFKGSRAEHRGEGKPGGGKPGGRPFGKPGGGQRAGRPAGKPGGKPGGRPGGKPKA